jgi:hypothetical protein
MEYGKNDDSLGLGPEVDAEWKPAGRDDGCWNPSSPGTGRIIATAT